MHRMQDGQPVTPSAGTSASAVVSRSRRQRTRLAVLRIAGRMYPKSPPPMPLRSVLLIRPDHVGDLLLLTPGLSALRRALPDTRITLLVGPWSVPAVSRNPDIDEIRVCPFPGFERGLEASALAPYRLLLHHAADLRRAGFDAAVTLRFDHWWGAWLAAVAGIPHRSGYRWPETSPFLTRAVPYVPGRHEVVQNVALLGALLGGVELEPERMRFELAEEARAWADAWLGGQGLLQGQRLVAIHPGAGALVKQWPVQAWASVGGWLREQDIRVMVTGGPGERKLAAAIAAHSTQPLLDATGQTDLEQLAALYQRCALVLGPDSGPLHLAVAVGTPTIHLFGPVSPDKFGPWGDRAHHIVLRTAWPCAPCERLDWPAEVLPQHGCVASITPEDVIAAATALLRDPGARRSTGRNSIP